MRTVVKAQTVLMLVVWLAKASAGAGDEVPHVDQCNLCMKCHVGGKPGAAARKLVQQADTTTDAPALTLDMLTVPQEEVLRKQKLANCTECYGCNTQLSPMNSDSTFKGITYHHEQGASTSWLFKATTDKMPSGQAVAKVYCVPVAKRAGGRIAACGPARILKVMALWQAIEQLSRECGFEDILPKVWIDKVNAVMPGVGYHIRWHGLWMEQVEGVSLESLLNKGVPRRLSPPEVLDLLQNKLNKTQVVRSAIFDLLTSQCDRHSQNIFVDENGQLKLIDNEVALQNSWTNCGFDSIFLPSTQKHNIVRFNNGYILKTVGASGVARGEADPQLLLDYRCWLPDGASELGTNYPPQIKQCLTRISRMNVDQVMHHYGLEQLPAENLLTRATDMLTKGFEWAMKYGKPENAPPKRYLIQPRCCSIKWEKGLYQCAHEYKRTFELPLGDPTTGRAWLKAWKDTGSFEGGSKYR